jgi:hypothetical protein
VGSLASHNPYRPPRLVTGDSFTFCLSLLLHLIILRIGDNYKMERNVEIKIHKERKKKV